WPASTSRRRRGVRRWPCSPKRKNRWAQVPCSNESGASTSPPSARNRARVDCRHGPCGTTTPWAAPFTGGEARQRDRGVRGGAGLEAAALLVAVLPGRVLLSVETL